MYELIVKNTYWEKEDRTEVFEISKVLTESLVRLHLKTFRNINTEQHTAKIVESLLKANNLEYSGILLANFQIIYPGNDKYNKLENEFAEQVISNLEKTSESIYRDLRYLRKWEKLFPKNEILRNFQNNFSVELIQKYINSEKFSEAGDLLRYAIEKYPDNIKIWELQRRWLEKDYLINYKRSNVSLKQLNWKGSFDECDPGTLSAIVHDKFLQRLNYFRRLAGIPDKCVLSDELNGYCQAAAKRLLARADASRAFDGISLIMSPLSSITFVAE